MATLQRFEIKGEDLSSFLAQTDDCPKKIFVWASFENWERYKAMENKLLAVVGSRKMTNYGKRVTETLIGKVAINGIGVVSGLMYGIDEIAHRAALSGGGFTVGVWGGGLDSLEGTRGQLARRVLESGVIVSEYEDGIVPQNWTFPRRNRIVAAISKATLVVEAAKDSGSLITAGYAANFGREVLAVPGDIYSLVSYGTNKLIRDGAKIVVDVGDILEVFGLSDKERKPWDKIAFGIRLPEELEILKLVWEKNGMSVDELVQELGWEVSKLSQVLTKLEIEGKILQTGEGYAVKI